MLSVKEGAGLRLGPAVFLQPCSGAEFMEALEHRSQNYTQGLMKALRSEEGPGIPFIESLVIFKYLDRWHVGYLSDPCHRPDWSSGMEPSGPAHGTSKLIA